MAASTAETRDSPRARLLESGYASDDDEDGGRDAREARDERGGAVSRRKTFAARTHSLYLGLGLGGLELERADEEEECESLDFHDVDSHWARRSRGRFPRGWAKWIVAAVIGVIVGLIAFAIDVAVSALFRGRRALFELCRDRVHLALAVFAHIALGVVTAAFAGLLTVYMSPSAKGSGVHYVMAVLNGVHVPKAFDGLTLVVKSIGTIFAVGSGLMIGPEGPLVHIGAAIAMQFTHGGSFGMAELFRSDEDRSDFISAGVSAGLGAAFGAPIGGVLFSLEEASSFWRESTTQRALFSSTIATFVLSVCRAVMSGSAVKEHTAMKQPGLIALGEFDATYYLVEMPFFGALAGVCGVISGLITKLIVVLSEFAPIRNSHRFAQVVVVTAATLGAFYLAAAAGSCVKTSPDETTKWSEASIRLWCKPGEYADVGSILLANKQDVISWVLGAPANAHAAHALLVAFFVTLFGMVSAANLFVPAGLFMPTILWGGLLGRFTAILCNHHAYALVGSAAALAGTFRATVSVVIILLEGVGKSAFLFPLLTAVACSNFTRRMFGASLYVEQLRQAKIPFLHTKPPKSLDDTLCAADICSRDIVYFRTIEKVGVIEDALANTRHNGFPVCSSKSKRVLGVVLRKQLLVLLSRRAFVENLVHAPRAEDGLADESVLGGRTPDDVVSLRRRCDLGVFMQLAPPTTRADASARAAWETFTRLSLRHLPVVADDDRGAVIGMITRIDLIAAAARRPSTHDGDDDDDDDEDGV
ncbi:chloride channel [Ostreococcus tauri]|uniref:Chloride channel protein n=1 Tax=Ostreococcus tauri TaxID=70448 RepID=A0A1Y5I7E8_OSTTA|nr:chloride channel [Ostreococcus tauri]